MRILLTRSLAALAFAAVALMVLTESTIAQPPGATVQSVDAAEEETGRLVRVAPSSEPVVIESEDPGSIDAEPDRRERRLQRRFDRQAVTPQAVKRYWIGVGGGPLPPELRAHVAVEAGVGVLVRTVSPGSPAADAGVLPFDVIVAARDAPITTLGELADLVGQQGEAGEALSLEVLRKGERLVFSVTPEERPVDEFAPMGPEGRRFGARRFDRPDRDRLFGPEGLFGGGGAELEGLLEGLQGGELGGLLEAMPQGGMLNGVSVSVSQAGDGPSMVTVRRSDQTWEFESGDEAAIEALPDDVRPMVERLLSQGVEPGADVFGLNAGGVELRFGGPGMVDGMQAMQQRIQALRERVLGGALGELAAPPAAAPGFNEQRPDLDEAPAFGEAPAFDGAIEIEPDNAAADDAGPVEIEIPAEP